MPTVRLTCSVPLDGTTDAEERFSRFPSGYTIKGMFFSRPLQILGAGYEELAARLRRPQPSGRYVAFRDYPQEDYSRVAHAAACKRWSKEPVPQAMRLLARDDMRTFAASRLGRVTLAMTGGLAGTLRKLPEMYKMSLRGGEVSATPVDDGVQLEFRNFLGWVDCYPVGTIEGLVQHYERASEIDMDLRSDREATFLVRWR